MGDIVYKDIPGNRFAKIIIPTAWQRANPALSGFEAMVGKKIDAWTRGMVFTWIWTDAERDWSFVERNFLSDNVHWVKYVPFFWRSGTEFFQWEADFVKYATQKRPSMSQMELQRQGQQIKRDLNLGAIQSAVTGAATKGPMLWKAAATAIDKVNDADGFVEMAKCALYPEDYEKECFKVVSGWVMKGAKMRISE